MREIKFRAWYRGGMCEVKLGETQPEDIWKAPLMQYTGLNDKNGKEIYEGDLIRIVEGKYLDVYQIKGAIYQVRWEEECAAFYYSTFKHDCELLAKLSRFKGIEIDCEIIGNIYENADLLNARD